MGNALFIVWRESLEAVLVIGILHAFLKRMPDMYAAMKYLWSGILGGVWFSLLVIFAAFQIQGYLQGETLEAFRTGVILFAVGLITQMVLWMNKHGRHMKQNLETGVSRAMAKSGLIGIALVAALAVAREGAETVIFMYSLAAGKGPDEMWHLAVGGLLGLVLALAMAWAMSRGIRRINYRTFFRLSGIILLFLAASLLVTGVNRLIAMGWLPALVDPVWDTSWLLHDASLLGHIVSGFTGYRAQPSLMLILAYIGYWAPILWWLAVQNKKALGIESKSAAGG